MLVMGIALYLAMSNLAWANDLKVQSYYQSESNHGGGSRHRDHSKNRKHTQRDNFGYDLELREFDELDSISTNGNYAEVVLEDSILGSVYIEQGSSIAGNKAKVVQSDNSVGSEAGIWQYGGDNTALITQKGNFNTAYIAQYGYGNNAWINQAGYNNTAAIIQYGYGSSLSINQTGSNNKAILIDNGGSDYGISQNGNDYVAIVGGYGINVYVTQN